MGLREYNEKRSFDVTPEPPGEAAPRRTHAKTRQFVVQKHAASHLHYDFRLELEGVLKSWSVPKGPSLDPEVRRLAMATEDHPIAYADFEGVIPKGQYGGGTVIVWDTGTWTSLDANPHQAYRAGKLHFELHGKKLTGAFVLVRKGRDDRAWLLKKVRDDRSDEPEDIVTTRPESVASGRTIEQVAAARDRVWHSNRGEGPPEVTIEGARKTKPPARIVVPKPVPARAVPKGDAYLHEAELPGERVQARIVDGAVRLEHAGEDVTSRFRPIVEAIEGTRLVDAILDGVVVEGAYLAFDLLRLDGSDARRSPLEARKQALEAILAAAPPDPHLHYVPHAAGAGAAYFARACELGARGVVSKKRTSTYGERGAWRVVRCDPASARAKAETNKRAPAKEKPSVAGVAISNPARVMFPARGTTKLQVAEYYEAIGDWIVPHVEDRPLTLVRCGDGLRTGKMRADCIFLRHGKAWGPKTLRRVPIREKTKVGEYLVADDLAGVIGLVQMDILEIHTWNTTATHPDRANRIVFDLDPGPDVTWKTLVRAARTVRDALADRGLESWVKTTGGAGLHVVAPVTPAPWEDCLAFVRRVSTDLSADDGKTFTTSIVKSNRTRKIYLDYLRNNRGNTSVAAYSTRARPEASVSVPLDWDELGETREPFDIDRVRRRAIELRADPWSRYFTCRQALP